MNRWLCKISLAVMITSLSAAFIVPAAYKARVYFSIGGEWLILGCIFTLAYVLIM